MFMHPGHTTKVAVKSSRIPDISLASLILSSVSGETLETVELDRCDGLLVGEFIAPLGTAEFHLQGEDSIGIPFQYNTNHKVTFMNGKYNFTTVGEANTEIESTDDVPKLVYRLQDTNVCGYASVNFTASVVPSGQFDISVQPSSATVEAGESVDVKVTAVATGADVKGAFEFKVSANDGCTVIDSAIHTVTIKEPEPVSATYIKYSEVNAIVSCNLL